MLTETQLVLPPRQFRFWQRWARWLSGSSLWRLLGYVRPHRSYAWVTLCFGTVGFLLSFVYPALIGSAVDLVAHSGSGSALSAAERVALFRLALLALFTAALEACVVYGRGHFNVHLSDGIVSDLRRELFAHLQKLSVRFYAQQRVGGILSRLLQDVHDATSIVYTGIIVVALDCLQLVLAVLLLSRLNFKLTIACVAVFPLYAMIFVLRNPRVRLASERLHEKLYQISGNLAEVLAGQALIKIYTAEAREAKRFERDVAEHHALVVAQSHEGHVVMALGEILTHLGTTIVIGYGGWLALRGELSAGNLTRYLGYVIIMYGPVRRFAELNVTYQTSLNAMRRVFGVFDIRPAIVDPLRPLAGAPRVGSVTFDDVWFRFADDFEETRVPLQDGAQERRRSERGAQSPWVLSGVRLHAEHGERVAIVGLSGAGKSTLLSLVPRLYDTTRGRVLVDGVDVRDYPVHALRSSIAVVQQESFLFTGSILEAIAYGRPEASEAEVVEAARAAHSHEFIVQLPNAYHTRLGERGVNLSGGQRQRLSIARAILKDPKILILDEATSSLDSDSESIVQHALERLMQGRTCFIIAHRLSTVQNADRIVVLDGGRVAEEGTHQDLVRRGGIYERLVRRQSQSDLR